MRLTSRNIAAVLVLTLPLIFGLAACRSDGTIVSVPGSNRVFGHVDQRTLGSNLSDSVYAAVGARVWIEGSADSTRTDLDGNWQLSNLNVGTYDIAIQKDGYSYANYNSVPIVGGSHGLPNVILQFRDTQEFVIDSVRDFSIEYQNLFVGCADSARPMPSGIDFCISFDRNRSRLESNFDSAEAYSINGLEPTGLGSYNFGLYTTVVVRNSYYPTLIRPGDTLYASLASVKRDSRPTDNHRRHVFEYPAHGRPTNVIMLVLK